MTPFLLFVFVFASQVIGGFNTKLPSPAYGNTISILSVDGGGIKGIIPSVVLQNLEKALQIVSKDEKAALADYFDVIAGTSTGGLIAAMLAAPDLRDTSRPAFTAKQILQFNLDFGPSIFNETAASNWTHTTPGPKFDGKFLHDKAREILQETRLHDTLTNVVIPTFDIKKLHPVIFSSFKALVAVSEVIQQLNEQNPDFIRVKANEPTKIVLLSLGCGRTETQGIGAIIARFFSYNQWIPIAVLDLASAAADIHEYHLASVFPDLPSSDNYYLRVEEYNLDPSTVNVTQEGMQKLVEVGEDLLKQPVKIQNVTSFVPYEKPSEGTNDEALKRLAEILYKEKQLRLKMKPMEKMGRPFIEDITSPLHMSGMA